MDLSRLGQRNGTGQTEMLLSAKQGVRGTGHRRRFVFTTALFKLINSLEYHCMQSAGLMNDRKFEPLLTEMLLSAKQGVCGTAHRRRFVLKLRNNGTRQDTCSGAFIVSTIDAKHFQGSGRQSTGSVGRDNAEGCLCYGKQLFAIHLEPQVEQPYSC
jgi:hypothetical protein